MEASIAVHYLRQPFRREPDFGASSVNYKLDELIERGREAGVMGGKSLRAEPPDRFLTTVDKILTV